MKTPGEIPVSKERMAKEPDAPPCPGRSRRTTEEAKAARKMGIGMVRIRDFKSQSALGRELTDAGCVELARGLYMGNIAATQAAIERLSHAIGKVDDPDRIIAIARLQVQLLEHHAETANKLDISGSKPEHSGDGNPKRKKQPNLMPDRPINIAIQNNVGKHENVARKLRPEGDLIPASNPR